MADHVGAHATPARPKVADAPSNLRPKRVHARRMLDDAALVEHSMNATV
jgi:hypothetical protein